MRSKGRHVLGPYRFRTGWRYFIAHGDGKKSPSPVFSTETEAVASANRLRAQLKRESQITIETAIDDYEDFLRDEKGNKPKSYKETVRRLRRFFVQSEVSIVALTERACAELYEGLRQQRKTKKVRNEKGEIETVDAGPISADYHRNALAEVKTFLRWCVEKKWLRENPAEMIKGKDRRHKGKKQLRIDEFRKWLTQAQLEAATQQGAVAAMMAALMGLRASEIAQRIVRDVDDDCRIVWVTDEAEGQEVKTEAAKRAVDVPDLLRPYLQAHVKGRSADAWLFPGDIKKKRNKKKPSHVDRGWIRKWVQRICKAAGVPLVSAHGMRGLFATLGALRQLEEVARAMGHEETATTVGHYADRGAVEKAKQAGVLKVIKGGR